MKKHLFSMAFITAILAIVCSCKQEQDILSARAVQFTARSEVSYITKTSYSGVKDSDDLERINWVEGDQIKIVSNVAATESSSHECVYGLSGPTANGKFSYSTASPSGAEHGLLWGSGTNTFYSVYPAGTLTYGTTSGTASFTLPSEQTVTLRDGYYSNMSLAFMTAATSGTEGNDITLSFTPVITTFYISIVNDTGSTMTLKKVALSCEDKPLAGSYTAEMSSLTALDEGHNARNYRLDYRFLRNSLYGTDLPDVDGVNNTIYANFNNVEIAAGNSIVVALFAMPRNAYNGSSGYGVTGIDNDFTQCGFISNLTLSVTTASGMVSLPLKDGDEWIKFASEHKHNLSNVKVPAINEYVLEVNQDEIEYDYTGAYNTPASQQFIVTSYKTISSTSTITNKPAPWKTQVQISSSWVDLADVLADATTYPGYQWLSNIPISSESVAEASTTASAGPPSRTFQKSVASQSVTSHKQRLREGRVYTSYPDTPYDNSDEDDAVDLSKYDFIHKQLESNRTTANTYIVSAPGWYKIPMLYGNIIENNSIIANSCKGSAWALGHLDYFKKATDANIWLGVGYPWLQDSFLQNARIHWEKYTDWVSGTAYTTGRQWSSGSDMGVIDEVKLQSLSADTDGTYLYFHVDEDAILPGNALLAVYDDDWTCCWSWQIWITDQKMDLIPVGTNYVLPVNLGWVDETEGQYYAPRSCTLKFISTEKDTEFDTMVVTQTEYNEVSTKGWQTYYQWGRKDPMSSGVTNPYQDDGTINESIKHPSNIMHDESNHGSDGEYYDWTSANYNNLWDSQNNSYSASTSLPNHKTVYDPSPRGFSVPPDNAWDSFSSNYEAVVDNSVTPSVFRGMNFNTSSSPIFFPASGYVEFNYASLADANTAGYYWTSHPGTNQNVQKRASFSLRFTASNIVAQDYAATSPFTNPAFRANAYSVRPVQYSVSYADSPSISGTTTEDIIFEDYESGWGWTSQNAGTALGGYYHQFNDTQSNPETQTVNGVTISVRNTTSLTTYSPAYYYNNDEKYLLLENHDELKVSVPGHEIFYITLFLSSVDGTPGNYATITASPVNPGIFTDGRGRKNENATWEVTSYTSSTLNPSTDMVTFTTASTGGNRKITGISVTYK